MNKKYFIYTRISDDKYEKSIDNQKEMLYNLAKKDWLNEKDLIPIEEKKSWAKWKTRNYFEDMISKLEKDLKEHKYSPEKRKYWWIYFFKIDRLARNDESFQRIFNLLDAWYTFKSVTETIENTPTWRLLFRLLSSFAIFESEKLSNRESLANIHNIIQKKFNRLWWKIIIFWYKINKDWLITIDKKEKEIVQRIYELFLMNIDNKGFWYKEIFKQVDTEFNGYLLNYLINKTKTSNEARFIENILKNKNMLKYNGYIDRSLNVNDELIKNYIETITEKKEEEVYEILWINKIWWKIKFSFYYNELVIINDILYDEVKRYLKENKKIQKTEIRDFFWLFEGIIYFKKDWKSYKANPYKNNQKWTYNYRKHLNWKSYEITEKVWIENKIKASWIIDKILNLSDEYILEVKNWLTIYMKEENKNELKTINANLILIKREIDRFVFMLKHVKSKKDIEYYTKQHKKYKELLEELTNKKILLEKNSNIIIEKFMNFFNLKSLFSEDIYTKREFYVTMFDKVIYDENKKVTIILEDFLTDLWLPKEITI